MRKGDAIEERIGGSRHGGGIASQTTGPVEIAGSGRDGRCVPRGRRLESASGSSVVVGWWRWEMVVAGKRGRAGGGAVVAVRVHPGIIGEGGYLFVDFVSPVIHGWGRVDLDKRVCNFTGWEVCFSLLERLSYCTCTPEEIPL